MSVAVVWLFKSYKILHVECDIWPVDSAKSCGRASNMATGLYAVSYTITHGSSVLHSKVQTVDAESETFNSLFKSSKSVDGYRIVDVCVAACPNGPWASIDAAEGLHVCRDIGYRHIHFKVEKLAEDIWCQNVSKGTILFKYSTKLSTRIVKHV